METINPIPTYTTNEIPTLDLDNTIISNDLILNKLDSLSSEFKGKYFYSLMVSKIPTRTNYHNFSFEKFSEISRKLINGQTTLGGVTNRQFWSKNFIGGFRILSVEHKSLVNEFPTFNLIFIIYGNEDNLDVKIQKNLSVRLRNIDPSLTLSLKYIGEYDRDLILFELPKYKPLECSQNLINKLGNETISKINDLEFQTPKYFGRLFKSKKK